MRLCVRDMLATVSVALAIVIGLVAAAQDRPSEINKPFQNPNPSEYVKKFETESREVYARRAEIVKAVGLAPGMTIADVGAGTGLFTRMFAEQVGPKGKVYAIDIAPPFLAHIAAEAKKRGHTHVETVLGKHDSITLPEGTVDVVFLCDTYHHIEQPAPLLASIHRALRPGGRLVVVELDRRPGVSSEFVLKHVRASKDQFLTEITAAGFEPIKTAQPPVLKENFLAEFRRVERSGKAP